MMKIKEFEKIIPNLPWPVRAFAIARGEINYNDRDWTEDARGFAVDLGTDGVAGHGYNTKPGDLRYFIEIVDGKYLSILNIQGNGWRGDGINITKLGAIHFVKNFHAPKICGCI